MGGHDILQDSTGAVLNGYASPNTMDCPALHFPINRQIDDITRRITVVVEVTTTFRTNKKVPYIPGNIGKLINQAVSTTQGNFGDITRDVDCLTASLAKVGEAEREYWKQAQQETVIGGGDIDLPTTTAWTKDMVELHKDLRPITRDRRKKITRGEI